MNNNFFKKAISGFFILLLIFLIYNFKQAEATELEKNDNNNNNDKKEIGNLSIMDFWTELFNNILYNLNNKSETKNNKNENNILNEQFEVVDKFVFIEKKEITPSIMINNLIKNVENYYEKDFIKKESIKESLIKELEKIDKTLEKIEDKEGSIWFSRKIGIWKKSAILGLKTFYFKIEIYEKGDYISKEIANYLIEKSREIEDKINE